MSGWPAVLARRILAQTTATPDHIMPVADQVELLRTAADELEARPDAEDRIATWLLVTAAHRPDLAAKRLTQYLSYTQQREESDQ